MIEFTFAYFAIGLLTVFVMRLVLIKWLRRAWDLKTRDPYKVDSGAQFYLWLYILIILTWWFFILWGIGYAVTKLLGRKL